MVEGIFLAAILVAAVVYIVRFWHQAFTGKFQGCADCPGRCGAGAVCRHAQDETARGCKP